MSFQALASEEDYEATAAFFKVSQSASPVSTRAHPLCAPGQGYLGLRAGTEAVLGQHSHSCGVDQGASRASTAWIVFKAEWPFYVVAFDRGARTLARTATGGSRMMITWEPPLTVIHSAHFNSS